MSLETNLIGYGQNSNVEVQVDRTHGALRASLRPPEKGYYGSYSLYVATGTVAAGMASALPIFQIRWAASNLSMLLRRVTLTAGNTATAFTAGLASFDLRRLTGFTVADSTNGTQVLLTSVSAQAKSTRFPGSQLATVGSIYALATSASGLTGGTKTADTNALGGVQVSVTATAGSPIIPVPGVNLWDAQDSGREPLELQLNQGFEVRSVAIPGTGTWTAGFFVEWDEVDPARYFA